MRLSPRERQQLAAALGCSTTAVAGELRKYENAAAEEYVRMILGQRVFTRGQDMREWRLVLIIRHVFGGQLPSERTISNLFQTSTGQSRSLLRAVMAKYQYELKDGVDATLGQLVGHAHQAGSGAPWTFTTDSENLVDALNREIANIDGTLSQIVRVRNTVSTYEIPNASYLRLKQRYGP
jgi:hypothetical protein